MTVHGEPTEAPDTGKAEGSLFADVLTKVEPGITMPEGDTIPSGEALQLLLDADPLHLTDRDLNGIIAYNRDHRAKLASGAIKKGQRPRKSPVKKKVKADASKETGLLTTVAEEDEVGDQEACGGEED